MQNMTQGVDKGMALEERNARKENTSSKEGQRGSIRPVPKKCHGQVLWRGSRAELRHGKTPRLPRLGQVYSIQTEKFVDERHYAALKLPYTLVSFA